MVVVDRMHLGLICTVSEVRGAWERPSQQVNSGLLLSFALNIFQRILQLSLKKPSAVMELIEEWEK